MSEPRPNFRKLVRHLRLAAEARSMVPEVEALSVTIVADAWSWSSFKEAARLCGLELRVKSETYGPNLTTTPVPAPEGLQIARDPAFGEMDAALLDPPDDLASSVEPGADTVPLPGGRE